ncbi:MAG: formyltransferase family protein, partial [Rubripirellula sp.]
MGTGPFAVPAFDALRQAGHQIALVVTRPMPPVKSRKGAPSAPVREWAQTHGLPLVDPDSINDEAAVAIVAEQKTDLLVVCDYGQILKNPALEAARHGGINLHGSL